MSVPGLTDEQGWELLQADPLAYIRELAYAHAEKLRDQQQETTVLILDHYRGGRDE